MSLTATDLLSWCFLSWKGDTWQRDQCDMQWLRPDHTSNTATQTKPESNLFLRRYLSPIGKKPESSQEA